MIPTPRRRPRIPAAPEDWTRRRLQVLVAAAAALTCALAYGTAVWVHGLLGEDAAVSSAPDPATSRQASSPTDQLAAAPLPSASVEDAQPGPLSTRAVATIELPPSGGIGPAGVPAGYPRTPEGALAQLIAIDRAAIEPAIVGRAQDVITQWSATGGPTPENWSGVSAVAALLSAAGFPATGAPEMHVRLDPAMGFIKGTVGEDFVIPCIDFVVTATTAPPGGTHRVAVADCQRMVWQEGRWLIGPGPEPAPAPSVWPGTEQSLAAGYRWLEAPPWTE